jgi:hypothetical protein
MQRYTKLPYWVTHAIETLVLSQKRIDMADFEY